MQIPRPNEGLGMTSEKVSFALCTLPFAICHLPFAICHRDWLFDGRNGYYGEVTSGLRVLGRFGKQLTSDSKQKHFNDVTVVTAPLKQEQQSFRWSIGIKMRDDSGHPVARRGGRCGFGVPYASLRVDQPRDGPMRQATEVPV